LPGDLSAEEPNFAVELGAFPEKYVPFNNQTNAAKRRFFRVITTGNM
jgi:hypothetical protein